MWLLIHIGIKVIGAPGEINRSLQRTNYEGYAYESHYDISLNFVDA